LAKGPGEEIADCYSSSLGGGEGWWDCSGGGGDEDSESGWSSVRVTLDVVYEEGEVWESPSSFYVPVGFVALAVYAVEG
jgi:hypothetical protein